MLREYLTTFYRWSTTGVRETTVVLPFVNRLPEHSRLPVQKMANCQLKKSFVCQNNYVIYLVRPPRQDIPQRGLGLGGLVHEKAHPVVPNP